MRLHPFSLTGDSGSPAAGDCARQGARKTTDVPRFFTIGQVAESREARPGRRAFATR
jgi:hypothetical protein